MMYPYIIATAIAFSIIQGANANFSGGDNFNDDTMDTSKWVIIAQNEGSSLTEINGRLNVTRTGGSDDTDTHWQWVANSGSYTQDWSVTYETVILFDEISMTNQSSWIGMAVFFGSFEDEDSIGGVISIEHGKGNFYGEPFHDVELETATDDSHEDVTNDTITLQITFDSQMKKVSTIYTEGSNSVTLGSSDASEWGMNDSDMFTFITYGGGYRLPVGSGQVYGDNLQFTPASASHPVSISSAIKLSFETEIGGIYTIQSSTNLVSGAWINFGDPIDGDGDPREVFDGVEDQQLFYRVLESN